MELEVSNDSLCVSVICGDLNESDANFTVYNDTEIDFEEFVFDVGGKRDSINFLPLKQFTCWFNYDTLSTTYIVAQGLSENLIYASDTIWFEADSQKYVSGIYVLEVYREQRNQKLSFHFMDEYTGDCRNL